LSSLLEDDFMKALILKFGGAAFSKAEDFASVADIIIDHLKYHSKIVVVVSAMANMTDQLLELAQQVNSNPPKREQDMLVSVGERISMSLLAMALQAKNVQAVSFTGSQSGIITTADHSEAKIIDVRPGRILGELNKNHIVIVAGFQGVSIDKEITTLGRGGSDTTAVALGVALEAESVIFYKDVLGMYLMDPKKKIEQKPISHLKYNEALAIVQSGAKVLHKRSLILAKQNQLPLVVKSFKKNLNEEFKGTLISEESTDSMQRKTYEEV
jgi:aspartate kinase